MPIVIHINLDSGEGVDELMDIILYGESNESLRAANRPPDSWFRFDLGGEA